METNKPTSERQTGLRKRRVFIGLWVSSAWAAALDELVVHEHSNRSQLLRRAADARTNRAAHTKGQGAASAKVKGATHAKANGAVGAKANRAADKKANRAADAKVKGVTAHSPARKSKISNSKSQISNLKSGISNPKS